LAANCAPPIGNCSKTPGLACCRCELEPVLAQLQFAQERFGDNRWVGSSCLLLRSPVDLEREDKLDPELKSWQWKRSA
jgi:hypothetical protein